MATVFLSAIRVKRCFLDDQPARSGGRDAIAIE
jgi:hypothetical protein